MFRHSVKVWRAPVISLLTTYLAQSLDIDLTNIIKPLIIRNVNGNFVNHFGRQVTELLIDFLIYLPEGLGCAGVGLALSTVIQSRAQSDLRHRLALDVHLGSARRPRASNV